MPIYFKTWGTVTRIQSDGTIVKYEPTDDTRAARGIALAAAVADQQEGDEYHLWPDGDYEGTELTFTVTVTVHGHDAVIYRVDGVDYDHILRFDGDGSKCLDLTVNGMESSNGAAAAVHGISVASSHFYGHNLTAIGIHGSTDAYGNGIRILGDHNLLDGVYTENNRYAGVSHRGGDYCVYRNMTSRNDIVRAFNAEETITDVARIELHNCLFVYSLDTATFPNPIINFNVTNTVDEVVLDGVTAIMEDVLGGGVSYDSSSRTQVLKVQNINTLRLNNCALINGSNIGTGSSVAFACDPGAVLRIIARDCFFGGSLHVQNADEKHELLSFERCSIGSMHTDAGNALYRTITKRLSMRECVAYGSTSILNYQGQFITFTNGSGAAGTPTAGKTVTGDISGATGVVQAVTVTSGSFAGDDAEGEIQLRLYTGTFSAGESVTFEDAQTADTGTISGDLGTDTLELLDNEFVYTGSSAGYVMGALGSALRGNIVCNGNTLTNSAGTFTLSNWDDGNLLMMTDRAGEILFDEDLAGDPYTDGGVPAPGAGPSYFVGTPVPDYDGKIIRNKNWSPDATQIYPEKGWVSRGGEWKELT